MKKSNQQQTTDPIDKKDEVQQTKDKHINQDFPGYPHAPSQEKIIKPKTKEDKATAEESSDGSANAFEQSEGDMLRGELDDDNEKNY